MKITNPVMRWFVSPCRGGVRLNIGGTEYSMSLDEADKLAEILDEVALYAKSQQHEPA